MTACRALQQPRLEVAVRQHPGTTREQWAIVFDMANFRRSDDATLRALQSLEQVEMSRRFHPGFRRTLRGSFGKTLAAQFRGLFFDNGGGGNQDSWFDADFYAIDGGSGKIQSFVDYVDNTHLITQATSTRQVAVPTADALLGNARSAAFVAASTTRYQSTRATSFWKFLGDGAGAEPSCLYRTPLSGTQIVWATGFNSTRVQHYFAADGTFTVQTPGVTLASAAGSITANTGSYPNYSLSDTASPKFVLRAKSSSVATSSAVVNPAANQSALTIGSDANGGFAATMNWRIWTAFHRVLNTAERALQQQFFQATTGVTP